MVRSGDAVPPGLPARVTELGDRTLLGGRGADPMVRVTEMFCGLLLATGDCTGTVALYVPIAMLPWFTLRFSVVGVEVLPSVAVSQPVGPPAA